MNEDRLLSSYGLPACIVSSQALFFLCVQAEGEVLLSRGKALSHLKLQYIMSWISHFIFFTFNISMNEMKCEMCDMSWHGAKREVVRHHGVCLNCSGSEQQCLAFVIRIHQCRILEGCEITLMRAATSGLSPSAPWVPINV